MSDPNGFIKEELRLNSTMVRLKLHNDWYSDELGGKSQFHYGSIKTKFVIKDNHDGVHKSQFHYGSIKTQLNRF